MNIGDISKTDFFSKAERPDAKSVRDDSSRNEKSAKSTDKKSDKDGEAAVSSLSSSNSEKPQRTRSHANGNQSFKQALKQATAKKELNSDDSDLDSQAGATDPKQDQATDVESNVMRRANNSQAKKEFEAKTSSKDEFVMPAILPAMFSVPQHAPPVLPSASEQVATGQSLLNKEALQDFVQTMQKEFGVSPQAIVTAFQKMTPEQLSAPATESTVAFINNLPLATEDKADAALLYDQMLQESGSSVLNQTVAGQDGVAMDLLTDKELQKENLDASLEKLNQSFFAQNSQKAGAVSATPYSAQLGKALQNNSDSSGEFFFF